MADSILRLRVDSQEYDNKLKRAAEGIQRYADSCRSAGGTLEHLDDGVLEFTKALGNMGTTSKSAKSSIAEMTKVFTEMSVQYNKLTEEEKNAPFGKALSESLNTLKGRIQEGRSELDNINKSLNGGGGLKEVLDQVAGKFGLNIDMVTKFGGVIGVTTTTLKVVKDAFFQSESNIDEWGRTIKGAEGAYDIFLQTLNNGNWSNFFSNLSQAITGARNLYDAFDRLNSIKANNAVAIAMTKAEIQQLRLLKQQGQDVDDKIKAATQRLSALQSQSATAGINAGRSQVVNTLRNGVNSIGGAPINDATLKYVADKIAKGGQDYIDGMKRQATILEKQGMVTKTVTRSDSQGNSYDTQVQVFDINALTKEQQKQYAIAKVVTERETKIQEGLTVWSQAVNEQASNAREIFRDNRYAGLSGSGGVGGGGRYGGSTKTGPTYDVGSLAEAQAEVQRLAKMWNEAGADVRDQYLQPLIEAEAKVKSMQNAMNLQKEQAQGKLQGGHIMKTNLGQDTFAFDKTLLNNREKFLDELNKYFKDHPIVIPMDTSNNDVKKIQETARKTAAVVGTIGQAFNQIENPAAKVAGTVAQAIANVAMAYSQTLAEDKTTKENIWAFIAAAAASTISMVQTISSIHSATGYKNGGVVKGYASGGMADGMGGGMITGTTYSNDQIPIMANAGEVILNKAQQASVAGQLQGSGLRGMSLKTKVKGTELLVWLDNSLAQSGRGELMTWGQ